MKPSHAAVALAAVLLLACTEGLPPTAPEARPATTTTSAEPPAPGCELSCDPPRVTVKSDEPTNVHAAAVANVDRVFAAMHEDLLACYRDRVAADPGAHAFLVVTLVIDAGGRVRDVETTGGARLGKKGLGCVVRRIKNASFDPIPGGGTRRIEVPLHFRRTGLDETT